MRKLDEEKKVDDVTREGHGDREREKNIEEKRLFG